MHGLLRVMVLILGCSNRRNPQHYCNIHKQDWLRLKPLYTQIEPKHRLDVVRQFMLVMQMTTSRLQLVAPGWWGAGEEDSNSDLPKLPPFISCSPPFSRLLTQLIISGADLSLD